MSIFQNFLWLVFTIVSLDLLGNSTLTFAKPLPTIQPNRASQKAVDLRSAIDRFFKAGTLEESWFAAKDPKETGKFDEFRKQALDGRKFILQLSGAYKSVRSESDGRYIVTFKKRELGLKFNLDPQGRITAISGT